MNKVNRFQFPKESETNIHYKMKKKILPTQIDYEHVTLILKDASSHNLEWEVKNTAKKYIDEGYGYVESYQMAYLEWIK